MEVSMTTRKMNILLNSPITSTVSPIRGISRGIQRWSIYKGKELTQSMKLEETSIRLNFQQFDMRHHLPQCLVVNRLTLSHDKKGREWRSDIHRVPVY